ncbi:MAG: hypothetical protein IJ567_09465 [Lachnospiraceae bacterium]|nr:hypothetical protein [Lachnospiraceae bacterium]
MENLFFVNSAISENKDKEIMILGTGQKSLLLFSVLLQNDIYVSNFIDLQSDDLRELCIMNKKIVCEKDIEKQKNEIMIVAAGQDNLDDAVRLHEKGYEVYFDYNFTAYEGDSVLLKGEKL